MAEWNDDTYKSGPAPVSHARPKQRLARFDALLKDSKHTVKGSFEVTLQIPWEGRDEYTKLIEMQGVMLEWRVTRK